MDQSFNNQQINNQDSNQEMGVNSQPVDQMNTQPMNNAFQQPTVESPIQPAMQDPISQSGNTFDNNKPPKKNKIGLIIGIVAAIVVIFVGIILGSKFFNDKTNKDTNSGEENNSIVKSNEIIKVESAPDGYSTYLLDSNGKVYVSGHSISETFIEVEFNIDNKVVDIVNTDVGLLIKFDSGEYYLLSNQIKSDKTIDTSLRIGSAKRIMLDNIVYATDYESFGNILFLTNSGELYELVYNANTQEENNVKKVMDNVKTVRSNGYNISIIDKNDNAYIYGYNITDEGILGTSDYSITSTSTKEYVSKPQKIAENVKSITFASNSALKYLAIYVVNKDNQLFIMGHDRYGISIVGENRIDSPMKIAENVKDVHALTDSIIVEKTDGSLVKISTNTSDIKEEKIIDSFKEIAVPKTYGGILIVSKNNELYGYGKNDLDKFGLNTSNQTYDKIVKIRDNVKRIFMGKTYGGYASFIVTTDGKLYGAGSNEKGALGIPGKKIVNEFTLIEY